MLQGNYDWLEVLGAKLILTVVIDLKVMRAMFYQHLCKVILFLPWAISYCLPEKSVVKELFLSKCSYR